MQKSKKFKKNVIKTESSQFESQSETTFMIL